MYEISLILNWTWCIIIFIIIFIFIIFLGRANGIHWLQVVSMAHAASPKKDMHVSSISTISRTSIFPELSSSKRVKASSSNNWTSAIATQSQSRKSLTTYILMHCLCNISLDLEFPINMSIMANPDDLWCTIFPTSITSKAPKRKGSSAKPSIFSC